MKRRSFFQKGALLGLASLGLGHISAARYQGKSNAPVVMGLRPDGCEIFWLVDGDSTGYIEYGLTESLGSIARNDGWGMQPVGDTVIRVRMVGLEPGQNYFYRVVTQSNSGLGEAEQRGDIHRFSTLDPATDSCHFSIWNDTHNHSQTIRKLAQQTAACDFLILNGDVCNDWHSEEEIAATMLNSDGSGINLSETHPIYLVRGNHDVRGKHANKLKDYCAMPEDKPWYAIRQGPVAIICLDTGEDRGDQDSSIADNRVACEPMRREQAEWLAQIIESPEMKSAPYRIVCTHIPLRWEKGTTGYHYDWCSERSRDLWHGSLVKWNAQLVISGHIHESAYFPPSNQHPYAQLVGGGPNLDNATLIEAKGDAEQLEIICQDLKGNSLHRLALRPLV